MLARRGQRPAGSAGSTIFASRAAAPPRAASCVTTGRGRHSAVRPRGAGKQAQIQPRPIKRQPMGLGVCACGRARVDNVGAPNAERRTPTPTPTHPHLRTTPMPMPMPTYAHVCCTRAQRTFFERQLAKEQHKVSWRHESDLLPHLCLIVGASVRMFCGDAPSHGDALVTLRGVDAEADTQQRQRGKPDDDLSAKPEARTPPRHVGRGQTPPPDRGRV